MAYTLEQKAVFAYRVGEVKKALKRRKIKYYVPVALHQNPDLKVGQLRNVMNAGLHNEVALMALERVAGIAGAIH